jgi:hypothetical protein
MPWDTLALLGVLAIWGLCGLLPWSAALIAARGRVPTLVALPPAFVGGVAGGLLASAFGDGWPAYWASLLTAMAVGAVVSLLTMRLNWPQMHTDGHR